MFPAIGLCHFCESHGPCVVFCTEEVGEAAAPAQRSPAPPSTCNACTSLGGGACYSSRDREGRAYCSRQAARGEGSELLLRQACVRSLSCEVSSSTDNALVFFSDTARGNVLSCSFRLQDTQARGLQRCFSFVVLMQDKMLLLNIIPFLSKHLQEVSSELQTLASATFSRDQAVCSQRTLRLQTGKMEQKTPRSLVQLTGKQNVFSYLHTKFSWILSSANKIYQEISRPAAHETEDSSHRASSLEPSTLRQLQAFLGQEVFLCVLYCTLIGLQIIVRGDSAKCEGIVLVLSSLLPESAARCSYSEYVPESESRLFFCKSSVAVPQSCAAICRIDLVEETAVMHWAQGLPRKWPTLMSKTVSAVNEKGLADAVLVQYLQGLKAEWLNVATAVKMAMKASANQEVLLALKNALGVTADDETLVNYWMSKFVQ